MRAKENPWSEVPETLADEPSFNSVQAGSDSLTDAEQIRHDLLKRRCKRRSEIGPEAFEEIGEKMNRGAWRRC